MHNFQIVKDVLIKYTGHEERVVVPEGITRIGDCAFFECKNLKEVVLPRSLARIRDSAFSRCSSLKELLLPEGLTHIGDSAFSECSDLREITLPNTLTHIGSSAFRDCLHLTKLHLPVSLTHIGDQAFYRCQDLKEVSQRSGLTHIGAKAFCKCLTLRRLMLPQSVTFIGDYAFSEIRKLREISLPSKPAHIGKQIFHKTGVLYKEEGDFFFRSRILLKYNGHEARVVIPPETEYILPHAFENCGSIQEIIIPESVTYIGEEAFNGCANLTRLVIPESVKQVETQRLQSNSNLRELILPSSVTNLTDWFHRDLRNQSQHSPRIESAMLGHPSLQLVQALGIDMRKVTSTSLQYLLLRGFAANPAAYSGAQRAAYTQCLRKLRARLLRLSVLQSDLSLLTLCEQLNYPITADMLKELIALAVGKNALDVLAWLLNYRNQHLGTDGIALLELEPLDE